MRDARSIPALPGSVRALRALRVGLLGLSFATLPACAGGLAAGGGASTEHEAHPLAERGDPQGTLVSFDSRDGDLTHGAPTHLEGVLFRPQGAGPFPAVVLLHGCGGLYKAEGGLTPRHQEWAYLLRDRGYVVLMPDSFNPRGVRDICHRKNRGNLDPDGDRARDAFGALAYLAAQPFVKGDRVGLMGWSHGSMTTLATIDVGAKARAAAQPMSTDFRVAVAFYPGCKKILETSWATKTPLTILMGESDNWTLAGPCIELVQRARAAGEPAEIVLYPGAYHEFDAPGMPLHDLQNIPSTKSHTATVGTDPAGRADAFKRVPLLLDAALKP
jgi:dienelactone hydrolase